MYPPQKLEAVGNDLQSIDQALIHLLQQRVACMKETQSAGGQLLPLQHQVRAQKDLLNQCDIPEYLWETLVTGCAATVSQKPRRSSSEKARRITVVGGHGAMGRFFCQRFIEAGHTVNVLEHNNWSEAAALLRGVDLVLLCVPLHLTESLVYQVAQYISPKTALADIASVKVPVVQAMLNAHNGPVIGLHPMFGPGVQSFLEQKVVVCPGRDGEKFQWLLDTIKCDGGQLVMASAEEHDQIMIAVQAARHFSILCLGVFLAKENIDIHRSLDFASPLYRMEINLVSRLFAQDSSLYADIIMASDDRRQAVQRLANISQELANLFSSKNKELLLKEFQHAHQAFSKDSERALKESNYLIKSLAELLAASNFKSQGNQHFPGSISKSDEHSFAA